MGFYDMKDRMWQERQFATVVLGMLMKHAYEEPGEEGRKPAEIGETEKREEKEGNGAEKTRLEERVGGGEERESERGERGEGGEKRRIVEVEVEKGLVGERWRVGDEDSERERREREVQVGDDFEEVLGRHAAL